MKKSEVTLIVTEENKEIDRQSPAKGPIALKKAQSMIVTSNPLSEQSLNGATTYTEAKTPGLSAKTPLHLRAKGCIEMIIGPMFAGKSTELLRRVRR
jgi:hypothetical protein